jgi:V8-like Glu-specific endopeptidase
MKKNYFMLIAIMIFCLFLMKGFALADPNDVVVSPPFTMEQLVPLTEDEMTAAQPLSIEIAIERGQEPIPRPMPELPEGATAVFPSSKGEWTVENDEYDLTPTEANNTEIEPLTYPTDPAYEYPFPFTRLAVFNMKKGRYKALPYRVIGKLFFTIPGQGNYQCTASIAQGKWVWTAGHCVVTPPVPTWHTNFTFIPGVSTQSTPVWKYANNSVALVGWSYYEELCYDIAGVKFRRRNGKTLAQKYGHLGFMYNASRKQHWNQFGYPSASPFDGNKLIQSQSSIGRDEPYQDCTPVPIGVGNDMTPGSSGGPWLVAFSGEAGPTNYMNGLNSFKYISPNWPDTMYGPYFGDGAKNIWDYMTANP